MQSHYYYGNIHSSLIHHLTVTFSAKQKQQRMCDFVRGWNLHHVGPCNLQKKPDGYGKHSFPGKAVLFVTNRLTRLLTVSCVQLRRKPNCYIWHRPKDRLLGDSGWLPDSRARRKHVWRHKRHGHYSRRPQVHHWRRRQGKTQLSARPKAHILFKLVKVWDYDSGNVTHVGRGHSDRILKLKLSPDNKVN